jgi:hypothetical protein
VLDDAGKIVGLCALGAHNYFSTTKDALALPNDHQTFDRAYDAIEHGFDAASPEPWSDVRPYYDLGLRLREEFNPITATDLERLVMGVA